MNLYTELGNISLTDDERRFLKSTCTYLNEPYLRYLSTFRLKPSEHIKAIFEPVEDKGSEEDFGNVHILTEGLWLETILYEIPLLALTSEAYFKFCNKDWNHDHQEERAFRKGQILLEEGCIFSEFGSRRRRDYHTQELVLKGLCAAAEQGKQAGHSGKLSGTSNVHFAMKFGIPPVGTVAHEWFMGIAAVTNNYENANELALRYWMGCFGEGVCWVTKFE